MSQEFQNSYKALKAEIDKRTKIRSEISHLKPKAVVNFQPPYVVWINNITTETILVEIIYVDTTGDNIGDISFNIKPGQHQPFTLMPPGQCQYLAGYYLRINYGQWWPNPGTEGAMTPARASQLNQNDTDSCTDFWSIGY